MNFVRLSFGMHVYNGKHTENNSIVTKLSGFRESVGNRR